MYHLKYTPLDFLSTHDLRAWIEEKCTRAICMDVSRPWSLWSSFSSFSIGFNSWFAFCTSFLVAASTTNFLLFTLLWLLIQLISCFAFETIAIHTVATAFITRSWALRFVKDSKLCRFPLGVSHLTWNATCNVLTLGMSYMGESLVTLSTFAIDTKGTVSATGSFGRTSNWRAFGLVSIDHLHFCFHPSFLSLITRLANGKISVSL